MNNSAKQAMVSKLKEANQKVALLTALIKEQESANLNEIDWEHVGSMGLLIEKMTEALAHYGK